jgi:hypothetical protein
MVRPKGVQSDAAAIVYGAGRKKRVRKRRKELIRLNRRL